MNLAKDFCDCIVSWEVQENRKISSVLHCSYSHLKNEKSSSETTTGHLYTKNQDDFSESEYSPVLLMPFLHPELTKASFCDLKLFVSPKLGIKFDRLVIVSTAKVAEFVDRSGELLYSVKGDKIVRKMTNDGVGKSKPDEADKCTAGRGGVSQKMPSRWFRKEFMPSVDTFEVLVRFSEQQVPNQLLIKFIGVGVVPYNWSPEMALGPGALSGATANSSQASIAMTTIPVSGERVAEAVVGLQAAIQLLTEASLKDSNPQLATNLCLDSTPANTKQRQRPSSPMAASSHNPSPSSTLCTGTSSGPSRRSSDLLSLQGWLEVRLAALEMNTTRAIEVLSARVAGIEHLVATAAAEVSRPPPHRIATSTTQTTAELCLDPLANNVEDHCGSA